MYQHVMTIMFYMYCLLSIILWYLSKCPLLTFFCPVFDCCKPLVLNVCPSCPPMSSDFSFVYKYTHIGCNLIEKIKDIEDIEDI